MFSERFIGWKRNLVKVKVRGFPNKLLFWKEKQSKWGYIYDYST